MAGQYNTGSAGEIVIGTHNNGQTRFVKYNPGNATWTTQAYLTGDGKFVIGNVNPNTSGTYSLYVEKGILTEQVKVAVKNNKRLE